ncbi:integrase core domain protein [Bordetella pertussis STO1-CHOM-0012]|nr:integrase core domain protein [Bordetella pertussis STO1-CHOM-0012]
MLCERFIQSALREWAYAHTYQNSQHRADAMKSWLHHYNWHRPHQGIGRAVPISRLNLDKYNLLTVHSYLADHWCSKGHILFCLEGELHTELEDGRTFVLTPGMSYQVADQAEAHRSSTRGGARLFIVD